MEEKNETNKISGGIILAIVLSALFFIGLLLLIIVIIVSPKRGRALPCEDPYGYGEEKKPIIYIYPEKEMNVSIRTSNPENFTITYPKYNNGWEVKVKEDGTIIDKTGKKYYALYWEGKQKEPSKVLDEGFVIKGEATEKFLEEKLELLGLNYKEKNEFIMYWLPKLEKNKYNYIRFQSVEEINNNMELYITPKPETLIRIRMDYKSLEKPIKVKEQKLIKVERKGYTIVEWGGTEINS